MAIELSQDQIEKLRSLGISTDSLVSPPPAPPVVTPVSDTLITDPEVANFALRHKSPAAPIVVRPKNNFRSFVPLITISGITIISFSGIILLKNHNSNSKAVLSSKSSNSTVQDNASASPSTAPSSIQSYLLMSQQYFTSALQLQTNNKTQNNEEIVNLLNQSILSASNAVTYYPNDYRGYYQRGRVYQSLVDSQADLLIQAIADISAAYKLNPDSAEITRDLAALYARKGDVTNTLDYLNKTVSIEPTKAQNFYDLAKIQQQTGQINDALSTYNRLIPLLTDPTQLAQVQAEKTTLEDIIAKNPEYKQTASSVTPTPLPINFPSEAPKLQASNSTGLVIAAAETQPEVKMNGYTTANSLSGTSTLPAKSVKMSITSGQLKSTSQVYLTILKGGKNKSLQVLSKTENIFTVGIDDPIDEDIQFKWWIIN